MRPQTVEQAVGEIERILYKTTTAVPRITFRPTEGTRLDPQSIGNFQDHFAGKIITTLGPSWAVIGLQIVVYPDIPELNPFYARYSECRESLLLWLREFIEGGGIVEVEEHPTVDTAPVKSGKESEQPSSGPVHPGFFSRIRTAWEKWRSKE